MSTEGRKGNLFFSASSASSVYLKAILRFFFMNISGTYFGEHFIDICDVADFGPFSHQLLATPTTQIHDCLHSWHGGGISIKDGGLN
jgi:hypothetical protein